MTLEVLVGVSATCVVCAFLWAIQRDVRGLSDRLSHIEGRIAALTETLVDR